jgi:hypothetical protein
MISSRTLLLSLIALNLLALAWWSGAMSPLSGSLKEPQRLEGQIEPQRLKLVGALPASTGATENGNRTAVSGAVVSAQPATPASAPAPAQAETTSAIAEPIEPMVMPSADNAPVGVLAIPFADKEASLPPPSIALARDQSDASTFKVPAGLDIVTSLAPDSVASDQWQTKSTVNASTGLPMVAAAISGIPNSTVGTSENSCMRFGGMSYIEAREVEDDLLPVGALVELERADTGSYLVYIDPLPTQQLASRKRSQLRSIGVTDLQVIRSGYYRNGISLGLLRSLPLAKKQKTELAALGVSSMRIGPVNVASARYDMVVNAPTPEVAKKVKNHEVLSAMTAGDCDR